MMHKHIARSARPMMFEEYAMQRDAKILLMEANGCNAGEIAEELQLHPATVARILRENGR